LQNTITREARSVFFITIGTLAVLGIILIARAATNMTPQLTVIIILGLAIAILSFFKQDIAAVAIIFSMILSPEIKLAGMPGRDVVIRFDDILLIVFFLTWLFKMAYFKNLSLLRITPLNIPILFYIVIAMIATWKGAALGHVNILKSSLYFFKYVEYFMIYFMFSNLIKTSEQLRKFLIAFFVAAAIVSLFGVYQIYLGVPRITAPFEGPRGEANTFGGYLLLIIGITSVSTLKAPTPAIRNAFALASVYLMLILIATYSRSSYAGLAFLGLVCLAFARQKQRLLIITGIIIVLLLSPFIAPKKVKDRVTAPFTGTTQEVAPGLNLNVEDSSYVKVNSARAILKYWTLNPIIGKGITSMGLVDTQYPLILGEMGLLGLLAFIWIIWTAYKSAFQSLRYLEKGKEPWIWFWSAVVAGYCCALAGLLVHAIGSNTFIIVRIMEPFYFLTAVVVSIPKVIIVTQKEAEKPKRRYALQPWIDNKI